MCDPHGNSTRPDLENPDGARLCWRFAKSIQDSPRISTRRSTARAPSARSGIAQNARPRPEGEHLSPRLRRPPPGVKGQRGEGWGRFPGLNPSGSVSRRFWRIPQGQPCLTRHRRVSGLLGRFAGLRIARLAHGLGQRLDCRPGIRRPCLGRLKGVTSENGKNRTVSRWHGLASRKRSFLRGFNENQIRASAGMACCFLENHSHIARLKQPSFENHENAVSRGWQLAQSRAVAGYRIS